MEQRAFVLSSCRQMVLGRKGHCKSTRYFGYLTYLARSGDFPRCIESLPKVLQVPREEGRAYLACGAAHFVEDAERAAAATGECRSRFLRSFAWTQV